MWNQVKDLMIGACDLHIHAGPDVSPRQHDLVEVAQEAVEAGMRALAFKDHNTITADRARIAAKFVPDSVLLLGGIVLNYAVGGLNPEAVEKALRLGAKIVWMPSMDSMLTIEKVYVTNETPWCGPMTGLREPKRGLTVLDEWPHGSRVRPEVTQILELIKENNAILDTCHLSAHECSLLIDAARDIGVEKIIVTHPNCSVNRMTIEEQKELAAKDVYLSYAFVPCMPLFDRQHPGEIAAMMAAVGYDKCLLFSDFGQIVNPSPVEGYKMFLANLLAVGVAGADVKLMASVNPQRLLELD